MPVYLRIPNVKQNNSHKIPTERKQRKYFLFKYFHDGNRYRIQTSPLT